MTQQFFLPKKFKFFSSINYDDNTTLLIDKPTSSTAVFTLPDEDISTGNASSLNLFAADLNEIEFNYHCPKVIPWHKTPDTIYTAKTIGAVRSRHLFQVQVDCGSNVCMAKNQHCQII